MTPICISKGGRMWVGVSWVTSLTFNQGIRGTFSANGPSIPQLLGFLIYIYTPMHHLPLALIRISNFEKNLAKQTLINILTCWRSLKMSKQIPNPHQKGFWFWLCILGNALLNVQTHTIFCKSETVSYDICSLHT